MAMTITYEVGKNLYLNLTNRCPCDCTFCIRHNGDGAYGSDSLWLDHDPSKEEIAAALDQRTLSDYKEIVICGYGEPTERLEELCFAAQYAKKKEGCPGIRLNTNGLADLIHKKPTARRLQGLLDIVSISLNAGSEEEYNRVTRPSLPDAFTALQAYALSCYQYVPYVMFSVVDVLPPEELEKAKALSERLEIPLRIRKYDA